MTDTKDRKFIFRTDPELADLIDQAVHLRNIRLSEWLREAVTYTAHHELAAHHAAAQKAANQLLAAGLHAGMTLGGQAEGGCAHPRQAHEQVGLVWMCRACNRPIGVRL